jgi:hypothetical protein
MNKLILALCFGTTKVAGFASYSGKDCILEDSCPPASNVDGFACSTFPNCQDPSFNPQTGTGCPQVNPNLVANFAGPFARFEDFGGSPWIYSCSDNTCGSCYPYASAADFAAALSIEDPFASCAADPVGITKRDPLNYCTATEELWCDWWTIEKGLDDEYKSSLYWEPYCSESSQINLCKPGSTCDSKEESDTPAENCLFNPTCFCLMDSLAGLPSGGGGSGPACTPQY